ncbi:MAG: DUF1015 domain-containing protein [Candidatus Ornithospirochaeta sp.]|nr:DUF1015 domain-containing protein [Candidatus Ornithospirochaeta sp.]
MGTNADKMRQFGLSACDILLPRDGTDLSKWAVVACDQFTSQPEYWERVDDYVGTAPSSLRIIFPECYLEKDGKQERIEAINKAMTEYLDKGILQEHRDCFILVKRDTESGTRYGLMASLDLEKYDYGSGSRSLIRATEGTILSRIPPRKEIRKNAELEIPHIMVLISDKDRSIIEPLCDKRDELGKIYETDLMENGGHITGYIVNNPEDIESLASSFLSLCSTLDPSNPLLFAMGDGNHSLATAKSCWEDIKKGLSEEEMENHPARWALVEIENIFDEGLQFEPIHRVFFGLEEDDFKSILSKHASSIETRAIERSEMHSLINEPGKQRFALSAGGTLKLYEVNGTEKKLAAGTIQKVIDDIVEGGKCEIDYIHGEDVTLELASRRGNIGIILPDISKETFFQAIINDGAFPRKTFSIGHANEKRYYMEARRIR